MSEDRPVRTFKLVYFSGTGGTRKATELLGEALRAADQTVVLQELHCRAQQLSAPYDLLVLLFPVHALNAPQPVYDYLKATAAVSGLSAAVIAVSGGGEVTPNKACRLKTVRLLERKGYRVTYEAMLIMPSNIFVATPGPLASELLAVLPQKVSEIASELVSDRVVHSHPDLLNRFLSFAGEAEKFGAKMFGRHLHADEQCKGCGLCSKSCPVGNIVMQAGKPLYGKQCTLCLRCVYACPNTAIHPKFMKFFVLKGGFRLGDFEVEREEPDRNTRDALLNRAAWAGLRTYLQPEPPQQTYPQNDPGISVKD